jgi:hypothetical protein
MSEIEFKTGVIKPVECFKEGWELIKPQYWFLFAVSIVGALIGGLSMYILLGAMICGIFYCFFRVIDGESVEFEDLFKGFGVFKPSLLVTILFIVPMIFVISLIYVPLIVKTFMGTRMSGDELLALFSGTLVLDLVLMIGMVCLHTLLLFAFPLIVDKELSGWSAVKLSAKAVWKNLAGVTGIWAVGFVVSLVGMILCFVGTYFTIPIIIAGNAVAYRKVFPKTLA